MENAQDARFSDVATGMSHRNDTHFPKRAGNTNELGRLSFGYFSFGEAKKSDSPTGEIGDQHWQFLFQMQ